MEAVGICILLISPIYWGLYKMHGRLSKIEVKLGYLTANNPGNKK